MRKEAERWLRQSEADLKAARDSYNAGNFEWACFQAQQSAEKSLKAFLYNLGYTSITTHSIKKLVLESIKHEEEFSAVLEEARFLDAYYIPTRYPNGIDDEMAPVDYFDKEDAEKCINSATSILEKVKKFLKS
ncbi:MAG: DNA-binding protein [Caldiserica bacterium]|nr:MAG: DNA-binding protein [Caldisericota bacterium]